MWYDGLSLLKLGNKNASNKNLKKAVELSASNLYAGIELEN